VLTQIVSEAIGLPPENDLVWVSPLEEDKFAEYMDGSFLRALRLEHLGQSLTEFWPRSGPRWDGLARIETEGALSGVLLLEAKSYPKEMESDGCRAAGASLKRIQRAFADAKRWWGVADSADWLGPLYQCANRLAHVYFLREQHGVPTWLVNLCVVDDPTWMATSREEWTSHLAQMPARLGFRTPSIPWVADVFVEGRPESELFGDKKAIDATG